MSTLRKLGLARDLAPECPSDLELDRLSLEELDRAHPVTAHVDVCPACARRMAIHARPLRPELRRLMLAEIQRGLIERGRRSWWARWLDRVKPPAGRLRALLAPVAMIATAAAGAFFTAYPSRPAEVVHPKGGLGLVVYRERRGDVERMLSGERFEPGDRLRFEVDLPQPGQLMIVGVEAGGDTFPCYARDGQRSVGQIETTKRILPGAVELDGSRGREQLHAILCPAPFSLDQVTIEDGRIVSPLGCMSTPFVLDKDIE